MVSQKKQDFLLHSSTSYTSGRGMDATVRLSEKHAPDATHQQGRLGKLGVCAGILELSKNNWLYKFT